MDLEMALSLLNYEPLVLSSQDQQAHRNTHAFGDPVALRRLREVQERLRWMAAQELVNSCSEVLGRFFTSERGCVSLHPGTEIKPRLWIHLPLVAGVPPKHHQALHPTHFHIDEALEGLAMNPCVHNSQ